MRKIDFGKLPRALRFFSLSVSRRRGSLSRRRPLDHQRLRSRFLAYFWL